MKTMILGLFLILALAACGDVTCEGEVCTEVEEFKALAQARGVSMESTLVRLGDQVGRAGVCERGVGRNTATIDYDVYMGASESGRKVLVFHEMGHCALDRRHTDGFSVMNANPDYSGMKEHSEELIDELFSLE